jgi:hypothetical protein
MYDWAAGDGYNNFAEWVLSVIKKRSFLSFCRG